MVYQFLVFAIYILIYKPKKFLKHSLFARKIHTTFHLQNLFQNEVRECDNRKLNVVYHPYS